MGRPRGSRHRVRAMEEVEKKQKLKSCKGYIGMKCGLKLEVASAIVVSGPKPPG